MYFYQILRDASKNHKGSFNKDKLHLSMVVVMKSKEYKKYMQLIIYNQKTSVNQYKVTFGSIYKTQSTNKLSQNYSKSSGYIHYYNIVIMNSKEELLRYPFQHRDYSFQSKNPLESSAKKSYYDQQSGYSRKFRDEEIETLIDFQLKRQREKTKILEERLKNKEIFISQMKQFQRELNRAFDQSQQELKFYKSKCQQLSLPDIESCIEEIAQLKEVLAQTQQAKKKLEDELAGRARAQSKDRPHSRQRVLSKSLQRSKTDHLFHSKQNDNSKDSNPLQFAKQFAGTFNNYSVEQILLNGNKLGKFTSHFLMMVETCNPQVQKQPLKQFLKFSWKWIKDVVKNSGKNISTLDRNDKEQILESIRKVTNRKSLGQLLPFIEDTLYENKHQSKLIKLVIQFYHLPENTSLRQLQDFLRKRREGSKY